MSVIALLYYVLIIANVVDTKFYKERPSVNFVECMSALCDGFNNLRTFISTNDTPFGRHGGYVSKSLIAKVEITGNI